jgi:hypothetical protein
MADPLERFFRALRTAMEAHRRVLKGGRLFLPEYLKGKHLEKGFTPVVKSVARMLNLAPPKFHFHNKFHKDLEIGGNQLVDFVLPQRGSSLPLYFLELESIDGAQLMHFAEYKDLHLKNNYNKLWYYYGTLAKGVRREAPLPRYFIWVLSLPDRPVSTRFSFWDGSVEYGFFHKSLKPFVARNPFRFYDALIKAYAAEFLEREQDFPKTSGSGWTTKALADFQSRCELVFITCTIDRLILSRGRDAFEPRKEVAVKLRW